jgi:tetratricopeptide (TPR) repeat protein
VGENPFESVGDTITRSDITIATHSAQTGEALELGELQTTAIHELGHALGLQGHSPYPDDIMYYCLNPAQTGQLTTRDKRTLHLLYKITPDIKNSTTLSTANAKSYYDLIKTAVKYQQSGDMAHAIQAYQQALTLKGNDASLYYNLGLAYQQIGNTPYAIQYYRKAVSLDATKMEAKYNLGAILINQGVTFTKGKDFSNARRNFQEASDLFSDIVRASNAPDDAQTNLAIARKNLALLQNTGR